MRKGYGRHRFGPDSRVWIYFDTDHLAVGRTATPHSVVYALFGVVVEVFRPEGHLDRIADANRDRLIRKWQATRDQLWRNSEWQLPLLEGESYPQWAARRWRHTCVQYAGRAADARALDKDVPDISELRAYAPQGIPDEAYTGLTLVD